MKSIFTTIRRTPYQSLATYLALSLSLFLTILLVFCLSFLYGLLGYVESRPQLTIYFQNSVSEQNIIAVREKLKATGKVTSVTYVSKNDAYNVYRQLNKDNPLLLEMVTPDILPASLEIYALKPTYLPELATMLESTPGKDEVSYQKNVVDKLLELTRIVRLLSVFFVLFLITTASAVLIAITHFKIALKKDELETLRLLGATNGYIRKPFMREAFFFGFLSATTMFGLFLLLLWGGNAFLSTYLSGIAQLKIDLHTVSVIVWPFNPLYGLLLYSGILLFGVILSLFSTFFATQKYLSTPRY